MEQRKRLNEKSRKAYVEGMKRYQQQGIHVLIDGKEADDELWEKIFEIRRDGSFYMGDYVLEDVPIPVKSAGDSIVAAGPAGTETGNFPQAQQADMVKEPPPGYGTIKKLKEIRFDVVYHR